MFDVFPASEKVRYGRNASGEYTSPSGGAY